MYIHNVFWKGWGEEEEKNRRRNWGSEGKYTSLRLYSSVPYVCWILYVQVQKCQKWVLLEGPYHHPVLGDRVSLRVCARIWEQQNSAKAGQTQVKWMLFEVEVEKTHTIVHCLRNPNLAGCEWKAQSGLQLIMQLRLAFLSAWMSRHIYMVLKWSLPWESPPPTEPLCWSACLFWTRVSVVQVVLELLIILCC